MSACRSRWFLAVGGLVLFVMAPGVGCDDDNGTVGPCVHEYRDAILQIEHVRNSQTQVSLGSVLLTDFRIEGTAISPQDLVQEFGENVMLRGDSLLCTPPCGFGTKEGVYEFTAVAPGYTARDLAFDVQYEEFHGGCPSYNSGGLKIDIDLEPR